MLGVPERFVESTIRLPQAFECGRLAVDRREQGTGLGRLLLIDALSRALAAAEAIGARAILVHAIDDEAALFYRKFGFEPSPLDPRQLLLLMKDLRATLKSIHVR
jgi:GNAT superfamily N-acetyltransferase